MLSSSEEDIRITIAKLSFGLRQSGRRIGRGKDGITKIAGHKRTAYCICAKRAHKIVIDREW
jgi:hypothetical protein